MKYLFAVVAVFVACSSDSSNSTLTLKGSASSTSTRLSTRAVAATVSPSSVKMKVYELWVSASVLCTDPIQIFQNDTADYVDLTDEPEFGQGEIANGTYPCLIAVFSDTIKATPESDLDVNCHEGEEVTGDICHGGSSSILPDGTTTNCVSDAEDKVAGYLTTAVTTSLGGDADINPPDSETDPTKGGPLLSALVVDGDKTLTMFIDFTDSMRDNGTNCETSASEVGFR